MAARAFVIGVALALIASCKKVEEPKPRAVDRCRESECREIPIGLAGVELGMTATDAEKVIGSLERIEPRAMVRCLEGVETYQGHADVGGIRARCQLELIGRTLAGIECSLDGRRDGDEHVAIAWALYQTLARQFGDAPDLADSLLETRKLVARWPGAAKRVLALDVAYHSPLSIIRFAMREPRIEQARCFDYDDESFDREPMIKKARDYLRDLTGPLEDG